jgi:hypothetical protein
MIGEIDPRAKAAARFRDLVRLLVDHPGLLAEPAASPLALLLRKLKLSPLKGKSRMFGKRLVRIEERRKISEPLQSSNPEDFAPPALPPQREDGESETRSDPPDDYYYSTNSPQNLEGEGQVTIRDLVRNCLRMRPERIIVGEVRGPEAFDLLQAMNTGHDGSIGTLHANSPREAISRIVGLEEDVPVLQNLLIAVDDEGGSDAAPRLRYLDDPGDLGDETDDKLQVLELEIS